LVVTTTIWLDWESISGRPCCAFSQKGIRQTAPTAQILQGIKNEGYLDKRLIFKAR
jgi:hypothetical protein